MQEVGFEEWVTARVPSLLRFAYLVTGSRDAADDAVQSALTSACTHWDRIRATDDAERYVRRMIANAHISAWRRFLRRESPVPEIRDSAAADLPEDRVVQHDAVWRVCQSLPARQRVAVVLRFYEDLTYPEIAELLGCAESTVRSQIHRALAALRRELQRQEMTEDA